VTAPWFTRRTLELSAVLSSLVACSESSSPAGSSAGSPTNQQAANGGATQVPAGASGSSETAQPPLLQPSDLRPGDSQPGEPDGWQVVFLDDFDNGINPENWEHEVNCWGGGNNEQQCYTARAENSFTQDGRLHIVAREESFSGPARNQDEPEYDPADTSATLPFTSARLRSKHRFDFKYGRVEVRAQLVGGQGMWPAFWMLPTDEVYGAWPASGEIDLLEAVNLGVANAANEIHGTLHYGLPWPEWSPHGASHAVTDDLTAAFHTFALEWEADEIRWFVDGVHYQTQLSEGWYNYIWQGQERGFGVAGPRAPYDQDFHLLLNLAVGGDFPGAPDSGWGQDRELLIDSVRVLQCARGNPDGSGCAGSIDAINPAVAVNADSDGPRTHFFSILEEGPNTLANGTAANGSAEPLLTFAPGSYQAAPGNVVSAFNPADAEHGLVWDITFNGTGNVYLSAVPAGSAAQAAPTSLALNGGAGWANVGELAFDLRVERREADTQFLVKLDSGYPNLGQIQIEAPPVGQWQHVAVRVADLLGNPGPGGTGLALTNVVNAFVFEPTGSARAHVLIDNVRLSCSVSVNPLPWQTDTTCGLGVATIAPAAPSSTSR
jgi:beta-glucanase (GH16 family)